MVLPLLTIIFSFTISILQKIEHANKTKLGFKGGKELLDDWILNQRPKIDYVGF